jgi:D-alanyl-D-alanine carboxypeptidase/D-alanyl-D-alanine-endopeptidase (penicillin-binding protein 4)
MIAAWILLAQLAAAAPAPHGGLDSRIRRILDSTAGTRGAHWGIQIADADSGEILFQENANRFFIPASNTKLFSTALALTRLGPEHRFHTRVTAASKPDDAGILHGDLILIGGGDPNLSGRAIPYQKGPHPGDPLGAIEDLASQVIARGVRRVEGDIVGDDMAYLWTPFPEGWAGDDPVWEYGAPVSALTLNDNAFRLTISPGEKEGDPAFLTLSPAVEFYHIDNRVVTTAAGSRRIRVDREPGSLQLRLWGTIAIKAAPRSELLGIADPALFAASALRHALLRRGVPVSGRALARHRYPNEAGDLEKELPEEPETGIELARCESAPLFEDLRIIHKVSQNLHAELALRAVAKARRGIGSREAGLAELEQFLEEAGIGTNEYSLNDGSGLSRLNLVTPAAVIKLLRFMRQGEFGGLWTSLLPVGGEDGTLSDRFVGTRGAGRIRAKTGTLSHVSALSGYAERASGGTLMFAIVVNNYRAPSSEIRAAIDRICNLLVE